MKKLYIIPALMLALSASAQDFHYSMFYTSPLTLNPACTGVFDGDVRTTNNYRTQWSSVSVPYKTMSLSADMPLGKKDNAKSDDFFALGFVFNKDNAGTSMLKTNMYNGSFSYTKFLGGKKNSYITLGYQAGYCTRTISLGELQWDSQYNYGSGYDPGLPSGEGGGGGAGFFDMSSGLLWNFKASNEFQGYVGGSVLHILRPSYGFVSGDRLYRKYVVHAAVNKEIRNTNITLIPNALVAMQGPTLLIDAGINFKYNLQDRSRYTGYQTSKAITFGLGHRFKDAIMGSLRYDHGPVGIGFCYDVNVSRLVPATKLRGSMEFLLVYTGLYGDMKNTRYANPRFM
jgi:type IX secretion system PorP/SprF family membrane protein